MRFVIYYPFEVEHYRNKGYECDRLAMNLELEWEPMFDSRRECRERIRYCRISGYCFRRIRFNALKC